jgi:hypothetical protein
MTWLPCKLRCLPEYMVMKDLRRKFNKQFNYAVVTRWLERMHVWVYVREFNKQFNYTFVVDGWNGCMYSLKNEFTRMDLFYLLSV